MEDTYDTASHIRACRRNVQYIFHPTDPFIMSLQSCHGQNAILNIHTRWIKNQMTKANFFIIILYCKRYQINLAILCISNNNM